MDKTETFSGDDKGVDEMLPADERKKLLRQKFFEYCKKGDTFGIARIVEDDMLNIEELDDKKWTGLQWAVVNGFTEIVKLILVRQEELGIRNKESDEEEKKQKTQEIRDYKKNEFDEIFKKPPNSNFLGKYNPLHWAAYKGFTTIVSLLIKYGYNPLEIDNVGNTSIHQAAASNKTELFKIFMGLGLDLEIKNDREHTPIDLTADKAIKNIIQKTLNVKTCQQCTKQFDFFNKRYLCSIGEEVVCSNCCSREMLYEDANSKDQDIVQCRCKVCNNLIKETENELRMAIKSNKLQELNDCYEQIKSKQIKICFILSDEAELNINRLEREKIINEHLKGLVVVENHKTIEKSVYLLEEMIKNAKDNKIELDLQIIEKSFLEKNRLLAEKELRRLLSNLTVDFATPDNLQNLDDKLANAKMSTVDEKFTSVAEDLRKKIQLNLDAKNLLELFVSYPIREYPEVEVVDPKKKSAPAKKPDTKKKKKKEPPFIIPDWAKELKTLVDKTQELKGFINISSDIGLDENFVMKTKEQLGRFNQEIVFRRNEEEILKKLEEDKKKKNKKK